MDMTGIKPIIISYGIEGWYPAGVTRLERSLIFNGYAGDMLMYNGEYPPGSPNHKDNPYAFKVAAIREAEKRGYKIILALDSSFWCIKQPHDIFDIINQYGVFGFRTGYNCAQTCSDAALEWTGFTRDQAEKLPEIASGAVGLNLSNPDGAAVWKSWQEGCDKGLFRNSRAHSSEDSADPRFLHARQDQSIWSLAIHKAGLKFEYNDWVSYYGTGYDPDKCCFFIGGL